MWEIISSAPFGSDLELAVERHALERLGGEADEWSPVAELYGKRLGALAGATDIIVERLSEDMGLRQQVLAEASLFCATTVRALTAFPVKTASQVSKSGGGVTAVDGWAGAVAPPASGAGWVTTPCREASTPASSRALVSRSPQR